jgi:hypothetical protein
VAIVRGVHENRHFVTDVLASVWGCARKYFASTPGPALCVRAVCAWRIFRSVAARGSTCTCVLCCYMRKHEVPFCARVGGLLDCVERTEKERGERTSEVPSTSSSLIVCAESETRRRRPARRTKTQHEVRRLNGNITIKPTLTVRCSYGLMGMERGRHALLEEARTLKCQERKP